MIQIDESDPERACAGFVRGWLKKLATGRADEAFAELDEPNREGIRCDVARFEEALFEYAGRGRWRVAVSDPDELPRGGRPRFAALPDGAGWSFCQDLPLDGKWSGYTVQFCFYHRREESGREGYAVVLDGVYQL